MAAKRASEEQEPAAKRAASSVRRLFVAAEDYRRALETCKQTIAAQCYCTSDEHLDAADTWIRSQPVDVIAKAVLRLVPDYATTSHIVYGLLAAFPAAWTSIVNGEPFVCRLYDNKQNRAGEMTQLFLELCSPEGANCVDSLGNTILYYAAEMLHTEVVEHLLLKLRCNVPCNKQGHHALFAPLLCDNVRCEPMQRIILAFNQARQRRFDLFDAGLVAQGMTILGWLVKYQQPVLVRTWLQARCYSGRLVPGKTLWDVVAGEKIEGIEITPEIAAIAAEFTLENRETPLLTALRQNDSVALKQLIREGTVMVPPKHQCDRTKPDWAVTKIISMGDVELLEMMLDRGIVTATSCKLCTTMEPPLCAAIMAESTAYYEVLMRYGAEINDDVEFAYMSPSMSMAANPVFHPILRARIASVDLTRRYKVSPECTCVVTIVDAAMRSKCADFVRELLVLGAAQSMEPRSSLRNAIHAKQTDIIPILLAHGATPSVPDMVNVAKQGNVEIFEMLKAACKSRDMAWFASTPVSHVCTKPAPPKVPFQSLVPYPAPKPT